MEYFSIIITLIFALGFGYILYLIFRDPILMFKTFLRGLKSDNWNLKIILFPVWAPIWAIDRLFGLKLYIEDFEEASEAKKIAFQDYEKYILIDTDDIADIEDTINSFYKDYDAKEFNYSLNGAVIKTSSFEENVVVKFEKEIAFDSFNTLIQYMDNSAPNNRVYHVKGILINKLNNSDSYFIFVDTSYFLKLIGKTNRNKKMYVDINPDKKNNEIIYYNSNIDYFKKFNFAKFEKDINGLIFKTLTL